MVTTLRDEKGATIINYMLEYYCNYESNERWGLGSDILTLSMLTKVNLESVEGLAGAHHSSEHLCMQNRNCSLAAFYVFRFETRYKQNSSTSCSLYQSLPIFLCI